MSSTWVTLLLVLFNYQVILRGISTKSQFTMGFIPCCLDQLCILFPAKKEKERPVLGFCSWVTDWVLQLLQGFQTVIPTKTLHVVSLYP